MSVADPKIEHFATKAELDAYFAADKLPCLICGIELTVLPPHLNARHGINADEYRMRFGIPFKYGLAGRAFRCDAADRMRDLQARGAIERGRSNERLVTVRASLRRRRPVTAVRQENIQKLLRVHGRGRMLDRLDFEEFLRRIESGRSVSDVGRDPDMPSGQTLFKYLARNPVLKARYDRIRQSLPLSVQARTRKTGALYRDTIRRLHESGMTWRQISAITGVNASTLRNAWRKIKTAGNS